MSKENNLTIRIEERLIALGKDNDKAHAHIHNELKGINVKLSEICKLVNSNGSKIAVLEEQNDTQKWVNRIVGAGFVGGIITKFFNLW